MDYEKAYKEALERAKSFEDKYGGGYAGHIFPELAESEDERIRQRLINLIRELANAKLPIHTSGYFADGQDKIYIAWLEKQKESSHIAETSKGNAEPFTDEQQPAGWNEGDEGYLQLVLRLVESDLSENTPTVRWLKALPGRINPQPKQELPEVDYSALLFMLLDAIDYSFILPDRTYDKSLPYPVMDKVNFIKKQMAATRTKKEESK